MESEENKPPADWTAKYWQWVLSFPKEENPLKTGNISNSEFLSLPCTGGGEDCSRKLDLSKEDAKKDILIPVFASEYCTAEVLNGTDSELLKQAREVTIPQRMELSIDDKELTPFYVETEPFDITVPANHMLENENAAPGTYRAVACGYWYKLKTLPTGKHIILFGGTGKNGFHTKVVYEVNVLH